MGASGRDDDYGAGCALPASAAARGVERDARGKGAKDDRNSERRLDRRKLSRFLELAVALAAIAVFARDH
jgi:hypothetical protein